MSTDLKVHIFAYAICAFISFVFVIITISEYGRQHVQFPWYQKILLGICLYIPCISVLIVGVRKLIFKM